MNDHKLQTLSEAVAAEEATIMRFDDHRKREVARIAQDMSGILNRISLEDTDVERWIEEAIEEWRDTLERLGEER